jgi:hypothetical protein
VGRVGLRKAAGMGGFSGLRMVTERKVEPSMY